MGYTSSTVHGIPVPDSSQVNNIPTDLTGIVNVLETGSLVKRLSQTSINALSAGQKPAGLVVYNTTTARPQISNGSTFSDINVAGGVYTTWSPTLTSSGTITGQTTVSGESRYRQADKNVTGTSAFSWASNPGGSGTVRFPLPTAPPANGSSVGRIVGYGRMYQNSGNLAGFHLEWAGGYTTAVYTGNTISGEWVMTVGGLITAACRSIAYFFDYEAA